MFTCCVKGEITKNRKKGTAPCSDSEVRKRKRLEKPS